ncbi:MAG: dihydrolipoyl dehydrogenase [Desulfohalobiaceae bacterium]|nr:dihydrolipoyl dehydrogenase [Desulfohalobiaceae bacterium]
MPIRVAVVGSGPGGYGAAVRAAQLGAEVTMVERDRIGGVCLNWGCIPTKTLKTSAEHLQAAKECSTYGVHFQGEPGVDMEKILSRKERVVADQASGVSRFVAKHGVQSVKGRARLIGPGLLEIDDGEQEAWTMEADRVILAPGTHPTEFPGVPFDGKHVLSSSQALELSRLPESMIIVGGGVVGCEFATLFNGLGSRVTLVEAMSRLLPIPGVDGECSKILLRELRKRKIAVKTGHAVQNCSKAEHGVDVGIAPFHDRAKQSKSGEERLQAELMVVCVGRKPNTSGLGLENVGVSTDEGGWIRADAHMQTDAENIFAIGDVLGPDRVMLAHAATAEAEIAAENAVLGTERRMRYDVVPGSIYTRPEVANVGLTEEQAREAGWDVRSDTALYRSLGRAHASGDISGQGTMISERNGGRILGVHLIGSHATELIAEATLALNQGCTVEDISRSIHPHPTNSEIFREIAQKALDRV